MPKITSSNPTGSQGPGRPKGSANKATTIKIAQLARWKVAGVSNVRCAELLQMTPEGVKVLMLSQDYLEYEAAIMSGHLTEMDKALAGRVTAIRKEMQVAVPAALRCLVDAATQRKDLPSAISAAKEILKRDPDHTLPEYSEETVAPGIPAEVIDQAAAESNQGLKTQPPKEVIN